MNSDAPHESAVRTSLIPLHWQRSGWGAIALLTCKVEGGKTNLPPFLSALNLRKT